MSEQELHNDVFKMIKELGFPGSKSKKEEKIGGEKEIRGEKKEVNKKKVNKKIDKIDEKKSNNINIINKSNDLKRKFEELKNSKNNNNSNITSNKSIIELAVQKNIHSKEKQQAFLESKNKKPKKEKKEKKEKTHVTFNESGDEEEIVKVKPVTKVDNKPIKNETIEETIEEEETGDIDSWFSILDSHPLSIREADTTSAPLTRQKFDSLRALVENHQSSSTKKTNFYSSILQSGTLSDKIAAMTLQVQKDPVNNIKWLETLIEWSNKKGLREKVLVFDALKDLFVSTIMPARKLSLFHNQTLYFRDLMTAEKGDLQTINWLKLLLTEEKMKKLYLEFLSSLETASQDPNAFFRQKAITHLYNLLDSLPEGENIVLQLLVSRFADPDRSVASKVGYYLNQLLMHHTSMKMIVVQEVEIWMRRPKTELKQIFYAVVFLSQMIFGINDTPVARKVTEIYFYLFETFAEKLKSEQSKKQNTIANDNTLKDAKKGKKVSRKAVVGDKTYRKKIEKKGDDNKKDHSRLLSAILSGINRALPYARFEPDQLTPHLDKLYALATSSVATQALQLLYTIESCESQSKNLDVKDTKSKSDDSALSSRFHTLLYTLLLTPSKSPSVFLNLLWKTIKQDKSEGRIKAMVKRMLQVTLNSQPAFTCGCMVLLSELFHLKPELRNSCLETTNIPVKIEGDTFSSEYDPYHFNPAKARAEYCCLYEMNELMSHFHPSVAHFAKQIFDGVRIEYLGDPLSDFSSTAFLDRFMCKTVKKTESSSALSSHRPSRVSLAAINSNEYLSLNESLIPKDELFMRKFYEEKKKKDDSTGVKIKDSQISTEDDFDAEEEYAIKVIQNEMKKMGGDADADDDLGLYDDDMDEDDMDEDMDGEDLEEENFDDAEAVANLSDDDIEFQAPDSDSEDDEGLNFSGEDDSDNDNEDPKQKSKSGSAFADADEFAALLESGEVKNKFDKKREISNKRIFNNKGKFTSKK